MGVPNMRGRMGPEGKGTVKRFAKYFRVSLESGSEYDIPLDKAPKYLATALTVGKSLTAKIGLSSDTTKIRRVTPTSVSLVFGFLGFSRGDGPKDAPPVPKDATRQWTNEQGVKQTGEEYQKMSARLVCLSPEFLDLRVSGPLEYRFLEAKDPESGGDVMATWGTGKAAKRLRGFLNGIGMDLETDIIPVSENVLPFIEEEGLRRAMPFTVELGSNGWPETYTKLPKEFVKEYQTKLKAILKSDAKKAAEKDE